ncbi:beta-lactamase family protein [Microbispora sp. RL4-1S]|uniref:Beta-lactamase family protein n=1 Tax=Microbispora oryzae TaxID=2806554 RepID=A0A940WRM7_9ACTN|nr:serine hydrolase domain-containing protein [Microbispora oryzae]MBP2708662.1 beta-lactamase family protein [Microbispora oryzae]
MRGLLTGLTVAALLTAACGTGAGREGTAARPAGTPRTAATAACAPGIENALRAWAGAGFSGSIAILRDGAIECRAAYGMADVAEGRPNTSGTVFSIGSVTKAVTAAAILRLADEGRLSLDDRVGTLLPRLRGPVAKATIRQLLVHTSGLNGTHGGDDEPLSRDQALKAIGRLKLAFRPGAGYVYSNAGYTLLALVVEQLTGGYRDYLSSTVLRLPGGRLAGGFWDGRPAAPGPRAVGYLEDGRTGHQGGFAGPYWGVEGNGGLAMTVPDLASWTYALFTGQVISPASAQVVARPGRPLGGGRAETPGWVSYDRSLYGERFLSTAGGGGEVGHNAVVAWVPGQRRVVAIASNTPKVSAEDLLRAVGPALLAGRPLPRPSAAASARDLTDMVGTYQLAKGGRFTVTAAAGRLTVSATGADAVDALAPPRAGGGTDGSGGTGRTDAALRAHEQRVLALLNGATQEGRRERASLEKAFGALSGLALAGTITEGSDIRTYVSLTTGKGPILGWYAVNDEGGVKAAQVPAEPPALTLLPAGDGLFRPDDPTGAGPRIDVAFAGGRMTITGARGTLTAERTG